MTRIDYHITKRSLIFEDDACGDSGIIKIYDRFCFMALIDALGHGKPAYEVAVKAETYLSSNCEQDLIALVNGLHDCLKGTRGAVAAICRLDIHTGILTYSGVGNISIKLFGGRSKRLVTRDGILGYRMGSPRQNREKLFSGNIVVMTSDGIREHFDPLDFPEIFMGNARDIASGFMDKLAKGNDDASCIALRYGI
jgi:hypothetical protein